jgi:hypothetical protein
MENLKFTMEKEVMEHVLKGRATCRDVGAKLTCSRHSLCVVNNQPVGNPTRKV